MDLRDQTRHLNSISVQEVASYLGVDLPKKGSSHCPFPDHDDANPSFNIFEDGRRWKCYGCDRHGGSIDFVKHFRNLSFLEAKKWLWQKAYTEPPARQKFATSCPKPIKSFALKAPATPDPQILGTLYGSLRLTESVKKYMSNRAFSEKTILESGVVEFSPPQGVLKELIENFGFDNVYKCGLLTKRSSPADAQFVFPYGAAVFPFFEKGSIVSFQARVFGNISRQGKWRNLNGVRPFKYNMDALGALRTDALHVCEGVMDTLSALQLGLRAVGLLGTSMNFSNEELSLFSRETVKIMTDWDDAGEKKAEKLKVELKARGIHAVRVKRPSVTAIDLNEYLIETTK
ncbi:hypothetical protein B6V75_18300 [Thioclava sp. F1Mire-8]|uniref:CHC2 zinc finger domain-containing protein n=1 Tax=Thioclava sp. F1Mire-8 TaxID=1973006 RepID=UPI000B538E19|nr:CHC2 zinc finger domain-containing protein [Thioclava sp. F1Mire-8]OWX99272.1 hypothetical protein B6V75_18300 [Thioclava sp. F1Mire-8]